MARVLQSRFDRKEEDTGPAGDISIKTWSRRWWLVEIASDSFESYTFSSGATSQCRPVRGRGASEGAI